MEQSLELFNAKNAAEALTKEMSQLNIQNEKLLKNLVRNLQMITDENATLKTKLTELENSQVELEHLKDVEKELEELKAVHEREKKFNDRLKESQEALCDKLLKYRMEKEELQKKLDQSKKESDCQTEVARKLKLDVDRLKIEKDEMSQTVSTLEREKSALQMNFHVRSDEYFNMLTKCKQREEENSELSRKIAFMERCGASSSSPSCHLKNTAGRLRTLRTIESIMEKRNAMYPRHMRASYAVCNVDFPLSEQEMNDDGSPIDDHQTAPPSSSSQPKQAFTSYRRAGKQAVPAKSMRLVSFGQPSTSKNNGISILDSLKVRNKKK